MSIDYELRNRWILSISICLFSVFPITSGQSYFAQQVAGRFTLLSALNSSYSSSGTSPCPITTIDLSSITSYSNINPADVEGIYDGIKWDDLLVNNLPCTYINANTTTFFEPDTKISPGSTAGQPNPWIFTGTDNSPLICTSYRATYPNYYRFTDDLPLFLDIIIRDKWLPEGLVFRPFRGDLYMFTKGASKSSDVVASMGCAYIKDEFIATPENDGIGPNVDSSSEPSDGPACISGTTGVLLSDGTTKLASSLRIGERLLRSTDEKIHGTADVLLSFSHKDPSSRLPFISLTVTSQSPFKAPSQQNSETVVSFELSAGHLVPTFRGLMVRAADLQVGERLLGAPGGSYGLNWTVTRIATVIKKGVYSPITLSGYMVLEGGIVSSCYTDAIGINPSHALLVPVRALYRLGILIDWCPVIDRFRILMVSVRNVPYHTFFHDLENTATIFQQRYSHLTQFSSWFSLQNIKLFSFP